jgi:hypothetical protein
MFMDRRWVLLAGVVSLADCEIEARGPIRHESQSIDRDNSDRVRVNLDMGAGKSARSSLPAPLLTRT